MKNHGQKTLTLRFRIVEIDNIKIAKMLTWLVNNMDVVIVPYVESIGLHSPFIPSLKSVCKDSEKQDCLAEMSKRYGYEYHVKRVYATGHGIFVNLVISAKIYNYKRLSLAFSMEGDAIVIVDPFHRFNQKQRDFLKLMDMPEILT